jgi:hypothetical protein
MMGRVEGWKEEREWIGWGRNGYGAINLMKKEIKIYY